VGLLQVVNRTTLAWQLHHAWDDTILDAITITKSVV
jgi:hypothetical protein